MTIYKEKKRKEKKRKGLLYLIIAIAIMVLAIACGDKPTQTSDFAEIDKDLPTSSSGSGDNAVTKTIVSTASDISSPVVVVSGNNLIIAYGEGNDIQYRTSGDGGNTFSKAMRLIDSAQYPYIFFDGTTVSAIVTKYGGKVADLVPTLFEINGTFQSGGEAYLIKISSSESMRGIINADNIGGGCSTLMAEKYFGKTTTIRTAAGAGIGIGNSRQIPLSEVGGTTYLILEAKELTGGAQSGWGWDLKSGSKKTDKGSSDVIKIAKDGSTFKTSDAAEKAGSYSIAANGTITGITGSPQVGNGTTEASIAEDGNGTIYTFTKEADGLVFRKFSNTISGAIK